MLLLPAWPLCTLNNEQNFILNIIWLKRMHTSRLQEQEQVAACCSRETGRWAARTQFPSHLPCIEIVWLSCYWAGNWNPLGVWHDSEEDEESRMPVGDPCRGLPNWPLHKGKLTATDVTSLLSLLLCSVGGCFRWCFQNEYIIWVNTVMDQSCNASYSHFT